MSQLAHMTRTMPPWLLHALLFIGVFLVFYLWPDLAFADDCQRDPFYAEDCLRTDSTAPQIAGAAASVGILSSLWGEARNTLSSIKSWLQSGWNSASQSASGAAETLEEAGSEIKKGWEWFKDMREANAEAIEEAERQGGYQGGYWQDSQDELEKASNASEEDIKDRKRDIKIAEGGISGLRMTLAALTAILAFLGLAWSAAFFLLAIPAGLLAYYFPDAGGFVQDFMLKWRRKK